jgi:hypothetical protein
MLKKLFLFLVGLAFIASVVLFFFGGGWLNAIVKKGVETVGPQVTGTSVELDSVNLSIFSGSGSLGGLRVGNPEGFSDDTLVSLGGVDMRISPRSLLTDTIVIEHVHLTEPDFLIEQSGRQTNLQALMANVESFVPSAEAVEEKSGAARKVIIHELVIERARLRGNLLGQRIDLPLPRIELRDIGVGEDGMEIQDVIGLVLGAVLRNAGSALGEFNSRLIDIGSGLGSSGQEAIQNATGEVQDRVRGLFNR